MLINAITCFLTYFKDDHSEHNIDVHTRLLIIFLTSLWISVSLFPKDLLILHRVLLAQSKNIHICWRIRVHILVNQWNYPLQYVTHPHLRTPVLGLEKGQTYRSSRINMRMLEIWLESHDRANNRILRRKFNPDRVDSPFPQTIRASGYP